MSERTSQNISPISNQTSTVVISSTSGSRSLKDYASDVIDSILRKYPEMTVMISSSSNGKVLTSTLPKRQTCENIANVLSFTDKCKVLVRKLLDEDLEFVRIKGLNNEIVVTFEDQLEIITIQEDDENGK